MRWTHQRILWSIVKRLFPCKAMSINVQSRRFVQHLAPSPYPDASVQATSSVHSHCPSDSKCNLPVWHNPRIDVPDLPQSPMLLSLMGYCWVGVSWWEADLRALPFRGFETAASIRKSWCDPYLRVGKLHWHFPVLLPSPGRWTAAWLIFVPDLYGDIFCHFYLFFFIIWC